MSYQPRAASGRPSGPSIGAISASAMPGRPRAVIDDAAAEPAALVADRDEARAVRRERGSPRCRRILVRRGQNEAAAEFELAEIAARRIARLERVRSAARGPRSGPAARVGGLRACPARPPAHASASSATSAALRPHDDVPTPGARLSAHACSLRRTRRARLGAGACSSNSSASFSVMAPPSSSASTMVTARR